MKSCDLIAADLKTLMKPERYFHTLGVIKTAQFLASLYGVCEEKAMLAALLHDAAKIKNITESELSELAQRSIFTDKYPEDTVGEALLHSVASEVIAREKYGITDTDILSAVRWHTTGKAHMSKLEMIIYSADMVEESRIYPGVELLRGKMTNGLEALTYSCMEHEIKYLKETKTNIHRSSLDAYNYLKNKINGDK